jgi:hypothetical protein
MFTGRDGGTRQAMPRKKAFGLTGFLVRKQRRLYFSGTVQK